MDGESDDPAGPPSGFRGFVQSPPQSANPPCDVMPGGSHLMSVRTQPSVPERSAAPAPLARLRQYPASSNGPYVVVIRECGPKLRPLFFARYINSNYKSTESVKPSPGKLKVVLRNRMEANTLVSDATFQQYLINIPADNVEVEGAVNILDLCDLEDLDALATHGKGIFGNAALPPCKIVCAERLSRINTAPSGSNSPDRVNTNTIKLTFEGQLLPKFTVIEGLRVRVRPFHGKPMFCSNCQQFGHTVKYCRRAPKCAGCGGVHLTSSCTAAIEQLCLYCQSPGPHDRSNCDYFCEVNDGFRIKQANRRKTRLAQAVAAANQAQIAVPNNLSTDDIVQYPPLKNRFSQLPVEEPTPNPVSGVPYGRPTNPYAKVLRNGGVAQRPIARARSASKRRRNETEERPTPNTRTPSMQRVSSIQKPRSSPNTENSATSALKIAIIAFAKQANISSTLIRLIEAVIGPLLEALLPQLPSILNALHTSVNND